MSYVASGLWLPGFGASPIDKAASEAQRLIRAGEGALASEEAKLRASLQNECSLALDAYELIKGGVLSSVRVDLRQGIAVDWANMGKTIAGGAGQLTMNAVAALTGTNMKGISGIAAGAISIVFASIEAASSGNWGQFAFTTVTQAINMIDDVLMVVLTQLITDIVAEVGSAVGTIVGAVADIIPIVGAIVNLIIEIVNMIVGFEAAKSQAQQQAQSELRSQRDAVCQSAFGPEVAPSSPGGQLPVDLFLQAAGTPCTHWPLELAQLPGGENVFAVPFYGKERRAHWVSPCSFKEPAAALNYGNDKRYNRDTIIADMSMYADDWARYGHGQLTTVPNVGKVMMIATEWNTQIPYARRSVYRQLRMAIQRSIFAGDGGQSVFPVYIDMLKSDSVYTNAMNPNRMRAMFDHYFRIFMTNVDPHFGSDHTRCAKFIDGFATQLLPQVIAKWQATADDPKYMSDREALKEMNRIIKNVKQRTVEKWRSVPMSPQVLKNVVKHKVGRSEETAGGSGGKLLALGAAVGGMALILQILRSQPRRRVYSYEK